MARVIDGYPPGHWRRSTGERRDEECVDVEADGNVTRGEQCADVIDHYRAEDDSWNALPQERRWSTAVADGAACYYVASLQPLTLQHAPVGDRYRAHPALLRGLAHEDIEAFVAAERALDEIFRRTRGEQGDGR